MLIVSARWFGATLLITLVTHKQLIRDWPSLITHWKYILLMGASGFALFNGLYFVAAHSTTAINLGIIQGSIPVFVLLGAFIVLKARITKLQILGVIITLTGVLVVTTHGQLQLLLELAFGRGDMLILAACVFYSAYTVGLKYRPAVSAWSLLAGMGMAAFIISIPMSLVEIGLGLSQFPTLKGWIIITMITLLPSLIAQAAFIQGVEMIGPERAAIFVNLVPVFSALFAVFILDEQFQLYHAIALALVLGGISLSEVSKPTFPDDSSS